MIDRLLLLGLKSLLVSSITLVLLRLAARKSAGSRSMIAHLGLLALLALPLASFLLPHLPIALGFPALPIASGSADAVSPKSILSTDVLVAALYVVPTTTMILAMLLAAIRLNALRADARQVIHPDWRNCLNQAQRHMGLKRPIALLVSSRLSSPVTCGLFRPAIVLNEDGLCDIANAEAIIAHELAHVARFDCAKLLLGRVVAALFWINPLVWMVVSEAHQLREETADDTVLALNISATGYAELLVGIARRESHASLLYAHGVAANWRSIRRRIARILDGKLNRGDAHRSWAIGLALGMLVVVAPLGAVALETHPADGPQIAWRQISPWPGQELSLSDKQTALTAFAITKPPNIQLQLMRREMLRWNLRPKETPQTAR